MRTLLSLLLLVLAFVAQTTAAPKTSLLSDAAFGAIAAEASGSLAKETLVGLCRLHRVQATAGFHEAAELVAARARAYGLSGVAIESFPADGKTTYGTFRSYLGWEAESGLLEEVSPSPRVVADFSRMRVALADYSNDADVTADLVDVGEGASDADYAGKDVKGRLVLAGGAVAGVHAAAVAKRGAAGVVSYQPNQPTGWSGDYPDVVRWGHLSPYDTKNAFAFMVSLRTAREYRARLAAGEAVRMRAVVRARMKPSAFEVVTATIPGADPKAGEILVSCHLCHETPGANDDASGAATILEVARVLSKLVASGALPRPRRTIRFLWPPEISGTACYLSRHPEVARRALAAIHMDMVGGDYARTKAVFHLTRTPASLPSCVNDVASAFGEAVVGGAARAAAGVDASGALLDPQGTREPLVAEIGAPFTLGSDHDVLEEGSYRVPTIYMNDWPDVFIHTNADGPENIDATKLRRVAAIGAASGYFLASAGPEDARRLALEVYARGAARQGEALRRALATGASGDATVWRFHECRRVVEEAGRQEREALASVLAYADGDASAEALVHDLSNRVDARTEDGIRIVQHEVPIPAAAEPLDDADYVVPKRVPTVVGPMSVYYFDYVADRLGAPAPGDGLVQYETLNLVDGTRTAGEIAAIVRASYGVDASSADVLAYLRTLERAGVVTLGRR